MNVVLSVSIGNKTEDTQYGNIGTYVYEPSLYMNHLPYVYAPSCDVYVPSCDVHVKDSQKIKIKKKTKTPRITDEGWNSQKQLSDPVEKKMKEGKRRKKRLLYLHPKLSSGLVPL